jgi:cytochrome b involved in lipid metabolism
MISEGFANKKIYSIKNCGLVEEKVEKEIMIEELAKHSKKNDCWLALFGKVYDVTQYVSQHPGGSIILRAAGKDATDLFNKNHPWVSEMIYKKYYIGILRKNVKK